MLNVFLQVWGAMFYLLNKIFFSRAERMRSQSWRAASWAVYLIGLPAWVIILISQHNWIAMSVEAGGAPAMLLGLLNALRGAQKESGWLNQLARVAITIGLMASLWDFGGITTIKQVLELGLSTGFLVGTYLLARQRPSGYLWFMLMNGSTAILMAIQNYPWLALEQVASLGFVADAFFAQRRKNRVHAN